MASEAPDVAEIAASIEGRCCGRCRKPWGRTFPGQAGGLAQSAHDPADRFPGESDVRVKRAAVEAMEERAGFVAAGLRSTRPRRRSDRVESCVLSRSGLSPRIQIAAGRPDPAGGVPPGPASTSSRSRLHSSAWRTPRSINTQESLYLSGPGNRCQLQSQHTEQTDVEQVRASHVAAAPRPGVPRRRDSQFVRPILRETLHILFARRPAGGRSSRRPAGARPGRPHSSSSSGWRRLARRREGPRRRLRSR